MNKTIIEKSANNAKWVMPQISLDDVAILKQQHDLPEAVARLLVQRGISSNEVKSFLNPTLRNDLADPFSLKAMKDMAEDVAIAIEEGNSFAIFGDFDVDGATSSAVLKRFLSDLGINAPVIIPDRLTEGYGPNTDALQKIKDDGADILFILDCGTTAFDVISAGTKMGLRIIIVDHHEAEDLLPDCCHLINPKRRDDTSGLDMLAAVGVTFMVCVAINSRLRDRGFYAARKEPDLRSVLDIVALGTVCDMVPLVGVNRLFVRAGFSLPEGSMNKGIVAIMHVSGIQPPMTTYHCGFVIGPRINAGSRVHKSDLGAQLLCSNDAEDCSNISWTLNDCNDKRKAIQKEMEEQAINMVEDQQLQDAAFILLSHKDWHPGLSGLVAGRIKEKYNRPTCVITFAENQSGVVEGRGSGRSVAGVHIAQSFIDARCEGLLEKGGGHAMAGGFTVLPEKIDELSMYLNNHVKRQLNGEPIVSEVNIDGIVTAGGVTTALVDLLHNNVGPFGQSFPEPVFMLENVRIKRADILGEVHIKVMISDWEGGAWIKAMAFRSVNTPIGDALLSGSGKPFDILGRLTINEWQGKRSAEMHIVDVTAS